MIIPTMEEVLIELLNKHGHNLTCFNCGTPLGDINAGHGQDNVIALLRLDPGTPSSRIDPGEPGCIYFECRDCAKSGTHLTKIESDIVLQVLQDQLSRYPNHQYRKVLENAISKLKEAEWYHGNKPK